ncbi:efflux RND transporter permease subunit [Microbispora sp. NBC_01389]|uniref:efflux RND transporter permease subunit n=1 Tax=Microbispora sp. NBC_01389 TaxID=2903584 RepID=UPI003253928D
MTSLARLSLANRALVIMITLVLAGFGLFAIPSLKQQLFPSLEFPAAFTVASYPGAAPDIVEEQVTKPIESAFQGIAGVTDITSTSREGMAQVQVAYEYGTDVDQMTGKMQQAVSRIKAQLPAGVDPQVVAGSTDDIPVMAIAVGDGGDEHAMADKIERIMVPELQSIDGVRDVTVSGARAQQVVITPDLGRMALLGLSATAIPDLLRANGVSIPAGTLTEGGKSLTVQIGDPVRTVKDLENLYLTPASAPAGQPGGGRAGAGAAGGQGLPGQAPAGRSTQAAGAAAGGAGAAAPVRAPKPVKLGDVVDVKIENAAATTITRTNGTPSLGVSITMVPDGNAVRISHDVNDALPGLTRALGDSAELNVVFDQAPYVERSIEDLTTEGLLGLAFAVLIILVFLLSVRSTLVTAVSIPLSVVIALIALWAGDYSLNLLTLGALTIAVGRVVDDSIVVLENIKRHLAYGEEKRGAVLTAVREVSGAVTASTLTTVAVFLPIGFVGGLVGELFSSFAVTVTVALLASLLVALTVIPVLAYWFLKAPRFTPQEAQAVREDAERRELRSPLQRIYLPVLRFATRRRLVTVLIGVVVFAATMALAPKLKTNFLDSSGNDTTQISQRMPAGTDLATTDAAAKKIEEVLAADPKNVKSYQVTVGGGNRFLGGLGGASDRASYSVTLQEGVEAPLLEERLRERLKGLTGIGDVTVGGNGGGGGFNSDQVQVIVQGPDQDALKTAAATVRDAMSGVDGLRDVTSNLEDSIPRVEVHVDREKAAARGLTEAGIGQLVAQAFRGAPVGSIDVDGRSSDVILRGAGDAPRDLAAIRKLTVPTATGLVKLSDVADVVRADGPTQITRQDGDRTATVSGAADASNLGAITAKVTDKLKTLTLPAGVTYKIGGASSDQQKAFADLGMAMLIAIAIVFMIMVATFRSLVQPLILLVSIPFAATGAIGLLLVTDTALGVPALIGMLMLIGIVVTNAIVLIDLINQYREQGLGVTEAVIEGGRRRLRPILMTAIATICALTPMALGVTGSGGFISQPLAIVVIGGLLSSTLLTLVLVPTLYVIVERLKERMRRAPARPGGDDGEVTVYGEEALEPAR